MRTRRLAALAAAALTTGVVSVTATLAAPASAVETEWQDGVTSSDTIINCPTQTPGIGVSGNVGWRSPSGEVPKVGERFHLRGYIGLISLPCSGQVAAVPEILVPPGVEFPDEPVLWGINTAGEPGTLSSGGLEFYRGVNGGIAITRTNDQPFVLRRGQIFEFQFPVRATRELKGTATPAPTCLSRRDGSAPCPVSASGDHLQIAFAVGGHGGDKSYVTPYVPLFAASAAPTDTTPPSTTISGGPANGAIVTSTSASFTLGSSEPGTMACSLDGTSRTCAAGTHRIAGLAPGTHLFRARATDRAGNTDATDASRHWTVPVPARSLTRSAGWSLKSASSAYASKVLTTTRKGAAVSLTVRNARRLALVASGGSTHGTVRVYAGARLVRTISLKTTRSVTKRVIAVTSFSKPWSGKVRVVVVTSGRTVRLEGLAAPTR